MLSISSLCNLKKHYSYTISVVRRRLARSAIAEHDIFTPVLEQEGGISEKHLISLAQAMVIAGADTVTTAMSTALYFLCVTPGCLEKLEKEVRALEYSQLTGVEVLQMRYLDAVIEESSKCFNVSFLVSIFFCHISFLPLVTCRNTEPCMIYRASRLLIGMENRYCVVAYTW